MKNAWRSLLPVAALILVLTGLAYLPALRDGFVFDDAPLITDNNLVHASDGLYRFWLTTEAPDYYPLTWSLWWVEWRLWGNNPRGYHVVGILLHAVNAVLVCLILRGLKIQGAWLAGLVFAVHPVNVATVAWISEQKNTLSMFFYALAILLYLEFDEDGRWSRYILSLTAFVLALLSKTAAVMLPIVLLGCIWWKRDRLRRNDLLWNLPFFVLSLILGVVTIWFQSHRAMGAVVIRPDGFGARLASAGWIPWFYLYKTLIPLNLAVVYPKWEIDASRAISYLPGVILVGCFVGFWWKRHTWGRGPLFGLGYFVVTLFPVLGFFDQGFYQVSMVADHWQYFSISGAIALAVAGGAELYRLMGERYRYVGNLTGAVLLMVLAAVTWGRSSVYLNNEMLWRDAVTRNPNAWLAYNNLGSALLHNDKLRDTTGCFEQALRLKPNYPDAHNNLGVALQKGGALKEAVKHYEEAVRIRWDFAEAHDNLGVALAQLGNLPEAVKHWDQALSLKPDFADAHYNKGFALEQTGMLKEAAREYEQALRQPNDAKCHYSMGGVLVRLGRVPEALGHWERAVRIKPEFAEAQNNLGLAFVQVGSLADAVVHFEQALRVKPDFAEAHNNLAGALLRLGRAQKAIEHWEQAVRIKPDYADAHFNLGIAMEKVGRVQDAVGHYEQALRINPGAVEVQDRLKRLRVV